MAKKATSKNQIINIKARVDLSTGTIHASTSALRFAGLMPAKGDKGITVPGFTDKKGKLVNEYQVYSVLDATPLASEVKTSKVEPEYAVFKELLANPEAKALFMQLAKAKK